MDTGMHMHHTAPADGETATDPVCGMTVAVNADAITREYEGKSYYFCGEHCATAGRLASKGIFHEVFLVQSAQNAQYNSCAKLPLQIPDRQAIMISYNE